MRITQIELRIVRLAFRTPFRTSMGAQLGRAALIVTVRDADGVEGYGEGVMEELPHYREETLQGALVVIRNALIPSVLAQKALDPATVHDDWEHWRGNPMAKSALETALWDCHARQLGVSLRSLLGGPDAEAVQHIAVGASLGLGETIADTVHDVDRHVDEQYARIKLKVTPQRDYELVAAVRSRHPDIDLSVDANSAYSLDETDVAALGRLDEFGLRYIEQPLHYDDLTDHAALARRITTPICLDESLTSPQRVRAAADLGACKVVNTKVARFGGITATTRVHDLCIERHLAMWCGGMLETGIGRALNIQLATLPGFTSPGDTASASRTYARDIVHPALEATNGLMPVPIGPGSGITLDKEFIASLTEHVESQRS